MMARPILLTAIMMLIAAEAVFACSHLPLENGYTGGGTLTVFKKVSVDTSLNLRIFNPPGWRSTDKRPVIVTVFGGAWVICCVDQFEPYWAYFTAQGFVCVAPDYRFGTYMEDRSIPDVKSAIRWVRSHATALGIDSNLIIGMGTSAGGHLSACAGTINGMDDAAENKAVSSRPNLLALFYPVLIFDNGSSGAGYRYLTRDPMAVAPAYHLTDSTPPTILMWGDKDQYRDGDSVFMLKAASTKMVAVKKVFKNAGHDFAISTANGGAVGGLDSGKVWCMNFFKAQGFWPKTTGLVERKRPSPAFINPEVNVAGFGNRIVLPASLTGKKVSVSLFDIRGKLIGQMAPGIAGVIERPGAAGGIVVARVKVVK